MGKCFLCKPRYMTRGIAERLPVSIQIQLWSYIDNKSADTELDYLQVFEFEKNDRKLKIIHSQELPEEFRDEHEVIVADNVVTPAEKIFVIDDETHCTMLWASEY